MTQPFQVGWPRIVVGALAALVLLIATAAPVVAALGHTEAVGLYMALEPLCHQLAERSWSFGDLSAGLCIRCYGVYSGIAIAALAGLGFSRRMAAAGVLALAAVWMIEHLAGAPAPQTARFASGGAIGLALASAATSRAFVRVAKPGANARRPTQQRPE